MPLLRLAISGSLLSRKASALSISSLHFAGGRILASCHSPVPCSPCVCFRYAQLPFQASDHCQLLDLSFLSVHVPRFLSSLSSYAVCQICMGTRRRVILRGHHVSQTVPGGSHSGHLSHERLRWLSVMPLTDERVERWRAWSDWTLNSFASCVNVACIFFSLRRLQHLDSSVLFLEFAQYGLLDKGISLTIPKMIIPPSNITAEGPLRPLALVPYLQE